MPDQIIINNGIIDNDPNADSLRISFGKSNLNFTELFTRTDSLPQIETTLASTAAAAGLNTTTANEASSTANTALSLANQAATEAGVNAMNLLDEINARISGDAANASLINSAQAAIDSNALNLLTEIDARIAGDASNSSAITSAQVNITALISDLNEINTRVGINSQLNTTEKGSIVGSINELVATLSSIDGDIIDDTTASSENVYSSLRTEQYVALEIASAISNALEGEDLSDLADDIAALAQADNGLVSVTSVQNFNANEQAQGRSNINSASQSEFSNLFNSVFGTGLFDTSLPDLVSVGLAQNFDEAQQAQGRSNIEAASNSELSALSTNVSNSGLFDVSLTGLVSVTTLQNFPEDQQAIGRTNIGSASQENLSSFQATIFNTGLFDVSLPDLVSAGTVQNFDAAQQAQGRSNIEAASNADLAVVQNNIQSLGVDVVGNQAAITSQESIVQSLSQTTALNTSRIDGSEAGLSTEVSDRQAADQSIIDSLALLQNQVDNLDTGGGGSTDLFDASSAVRQVTATNVYIAWEFTDGSGYEAVSQIRSTGGREGTATNSLPIPSDLSTLTYS